MTPRQPKTRRALSPRLPRADAWGTAGAGRGGAGAHWLPVIMVWPRNRLGSSHRTGSVGRLRDAVGPPTVASPPRASQRDFGFLFQDDAGKNK